MGYVMYNFPSARIIVARNCSCQPFYLNEEIFSDDELVFNRECLDENVSNLFERGNKIVVPDLRHFTNSYDKTKQFFSIFICNDKGIFEENNLRVPVKFVGSFPYIESDSSTFPNIPDKLINHIKTVTTKLQEYEGTITKIFGTKKGEWTFRKAVISLASDNSIAEFAKKIREICKDEEANGKSQDEVLDKIESCADLPNCNTFPFGKPSDWFPKLLITCRDPYTFEEILKYIFDTWCKNTSEKFFNREVVLITDKWNKTLFDRCKQRYEKFLYGVYFDIMILD